MRRVCFPKASGRCLSVWTAGSLYDIRLQDPLAIGDAVVLLSGAALLAALIHALRASRVDPALALREE